MSGQHLRAWNKTFAEAVENCRIVLPPVRGRVFHDDGNTPDIPLRPEDMRIKILSESHRTGVSPEIAHKALAPDIAKPFSWDTLRCYLARDPRYTDAGSVWHMDALLRFYHKLPGLDVPVAANEVFSKKAYQGQRVHWIAPGVGAAQVSRFIGRGRPVPSSDFCKQFRACHGDDFKGSLPELMWARPDGAQRVKRSPREAVALSLRLLEEKFGVDTRQAWRPTPADPLTP